MDNQITQVDSTEHVETEQIVTFHEDGDVVTQSEAPPLTPMVFLESGTDALEHSVKDFLERPVEVLNFDWTLAQGAGNELIPAVALPADWLKIPMIREKLQGFNFLRCDFEVKVQVNAQPFHAGRLLVVHEPLRNQQEYTPSNFQHFGGATGYRRVDLDLSEATAASITIPFLSNVTHFDLLKAIGNLGHVRFFVYSALTGTTDVEGTVWIQARNVRVEVPTGLAPWPRVVGHFQSNNSASKSSGKIDPAVVQTQESKGPGVVTKGAKFVSSVAGALTTVPLLAPVASAVNWVADAVAGVASIFGWSKPLDVAPVTRVVPSFGADMANYNGDSKAKVLALARDNEIVVPTEVYGTDEDEMALKAVLRRPIFLDRFSINKSNLPNQIVWAMPVSPMACPKNTAIGYTRIKLNTMLSYIGEMFQNWRGSIQYDFHFVKTVYHSARLRISFVPGAFEETPIGAIDINKVYSEIVDLRNVNKFTFKVPFVYNQPWASNRTLSNLANRMSETIPTGMVYVEVLNALRNPAAAADHLEVIVEVSAGDDFQFSYPWVLADGYAPLPTLPVAFLSQVSEKEAIGARKLGDRTHGPKPVEKAETMQEVGKCKYDFDTFENIKSSLNPPPTKPELELRIEDPKSVGPVKPEPVVTTFRFMTNAEMLKLPMGSEKDIPILLPEANPTKQYDLYTQGVLWNKFLASNPQADKDRAWALFVHQYPVPQQPVERAKRETGEIQSNIVKRSDQENLAVNVFGMGEVVTSLRQLLKRYTFVGEATTTQSDGVSYAPGAFPGMNGQLPVFVPNSHRDYLSRISYIYRWWSGSFRVAVQPRLGVDEANHPILAKGIAGFDATIAPSGNNKLIIAGNIRVDDGRAITSVFPTAEKFTELVLPFYQRTLALPTQVGGIRPAEIDRGVFGLDYVPANYGTSVSFRGASTLTVWEAVGDDFSFGYLIGPPISGIAAT